MIITLEHNGQPCLDSCSDKKLSLDILLPEQSYYPERYIHPVLGHIHTGYDASISSTSDSRSEVTNDFDPPELSTTPKRKRWQLFNSSLLFKKRPPEDPLLSGSTMVEKPRRRQVRKRRSLSWAELRRKWLVGWVVLSLLLCLVVALAVWLAARRAYRGVFFHAVNSEWSPMESTIYTSPPELFGCFIDPSDDELNVLNALIHVLPGHEGQHTFTIQGGASGQLTLTSSPDPNALDVTYDIVIHSKPPFPNKVSFNPPPPPPAPPAPPAPAPLPPSPDFSIDTPTVQRGPKDPPACMRFDITVYIPRNLRHMTVNVSTPVQIIFSPQAHIELDSLSIITTNSHPKSRIDSSESVQARSIFVEMETGIIQGLLSLGESSKITNWNGQIQLDTIPSAPMDFFSPSKALLETTSHGKVEINYIKNKAYRRRLIESWHTMGTGDNSTGKFDYGCSGFNGVLYSNSSKYNISDPNFWKTKRLDTVEDSTWLLMFGNRTGEDKIFIKSGSGSIVLPDNSHI